MPFSDVVFLCPLMLPAPLCARLHETMIYVILFYRIIIYVCIIQIISFRRIPPVMISCFTYYTGLPFIICLISGIRGEYMFQLLKKQPPSRIIALGFILVILIGSVLLSLPCCIKNGISIRYIDSLYTSTSAVCVTGLITVDPYDTFTPLGQLIIGIMIQIGGLGVAAVGTGIILAMGKKVDMKGRNVIREAMNLDSGKGTITFIKSVFLTTLFFEIIGAILNFVFFIRDYSPLRAAGLSLFHSVSAFNNAGFDLLGNFQSLTSYRDNVYINLVTCAMIIAGGIGFLVIREIIDKKFNWHRFSMHTKVVLSFSAFLIVVGTLLIKLTEDISWLGAFFLSVSSRTAGFSTSSLGSFSSAGLLIIMPFMFIGASSGSTGGGIKTTTFFVLLQGIKSSATNKAEKAFKYAIPSNAFRKASVIALMALGVIFVSTYLLLLMEPGISFLDALFEMTSACGTVGISTGITTGLCTGSKLLSIVVMFIGRLGPLTIASLWYFSKGERTSYPDGNIAIG